MQTHPHSNPAFPTLIHEPGAEVSKEIVTGSRHEGLLKFEEAKRRLNDVNNWYKLCGEGSQNFQLTDPTGKPVYTTYPERGDLIRILNDSTGANNYTWVRVEGFVKTEDAGYDEEIYGFFVRPVHDPSLPREKRKSVYTSAVVSTFLVVRQGTKVEAIEKEEEVYEKPVSWLKKIRMMLAALTAYVGISTHPWKKLVHGLVAGKA
jgi:hypothetical protein